MTSKGEGKASGAGTIINAIASYRGAAFSIDLWTHARVELGEDLRGIESRIEIRGKEIKGEDQLVKRCVELVTKRFCGTRMGGFVETRSDIPMASGLKSSSAAANAVVIATLRALGMSIGNDNKDKITPMEAIRMGVRAAIDTGVSITGAFDDASASMLGGVTITENREMKLLKRFELKKKILLLIPARKSYTKDVDVNRMRVLSSFFDLAHELALDGKIEEAMTMNGFLVCAALRSSVEPMMSALRCGMKGVSLSGTGPSYAAIISNEDKMKELEEAWKECIDTVYEEADVIKTEINNKAAYSDFDRGDLSVLRAKGD